MCQAPSGRLSWAVSGPGLGCGVSAQRWVGGQGRCGSGCHSERGDRASGLSLASALSARSRAFPLPHHPGGGCGLQGPPEGPAEREGPGAQSGPLPPVTQQAPEVWAVKSWGPGLRGLGLGYSWQDPSFRENPSSGQHPRSESRATAPSPSPLTPQAWTAGAGAGEDAAAGRRGQRSPAPGPWGCPPGRPSACPPAFCLAVRSEGPGWGRAASRGPGLWPPALRGQWELNCLSRPGCSERAPGLAARLTRAGPGLPSPPGPRGHNPEGRGWGWEW